jgi:hypothetical protein
LRGNRRFRGSIEGRLELEGRLAREPVFINHPSIVVPLPDANTHAVRGKVIFYCMLLLKNGSNVRESARRTCLVRSPAIRGFFAP